MADKKEDKPQFKKGEVVFVTEWTTGLYKKIESVGRHQDGYGILQWGYILEGKPSITYFFGGIRKLTAEEKGEGK